jgi:hypothetical protein
MTTAPTTVAPTARSWRSWSLRLAPYVVTAAVVGALLHRYPAADVAHQMAAGHALRMFPFAFVAAFVVWLPYAACDRIILGGVVGRIALREVVRAKAAISVLQTLGYVVGGGGYAVWIARTTHARPAHAAGVILYMMMSDLVAVCGVAAVAIGLAGPDGDHAVRTVATWVFAVLIALILVGPYGGWMRLPALFDPWRLVPRGWSLLQILVRAGNILFMTALTWGGMRAFGVDVPARAAAMYVPVIILVTALPINVAGLGAAQAAWLLFLPWASGAQLLAFQVLWHLFAGIGLVVRGLPFLRGVTREIEQARAIA